jgi:MFS family permease
MKTDSIRSDPALIIPAEKQRFSGWKVLAVLWFLFMNFSLVVYGGAVLNAYMARGLNMPRDSFGAGVSLAYLLMGIAAPLTAFLLNKVGSRLTLFLGMLLLGLGSLCLGLFVRNSLGFTISYGVICGLGLSIGGLLPLQNVVANWFSRRRSLATAILLSSGGVGGLLASYLFSFLIENIGMSWQNIWLLMAGFSTLLAFFALLFVRNHPSDLGQFIDGIDLEKLSHQQRQELKNGKKVHQTQHEWTFKEAMSTPAAWLLLVGSMAMGVGFEFCSAYGVIHLMDIGFSNTVAALSVGALAFFAIVGRLVTGFLGDRIELRWIMIAGSFLIGVGCLLVIAPPTEGLVTLYAALTGLGQGLVFVAIFTVMPNYFGTKATPSIFGVGMPFLSAATAGMIYLGGVIRTNTSSYVTGFIACAIISLVATLACIAAKPPRYPAEQKEGE